MRVEMREAALSKARGVGVVTNVSRKGTQFTCFISTNIQKLMLTRAKAGMCLTGFQVGRPPYPYADVCRRMQAGMFLSSGTTIYPYADVC
jgi:hypothetical protein